MFVLKFPVETMHYKRLKLQSLRDAFFFVNVKVLVSTHPSAGRIQDQRWEEVLTRAAPSSSSSQCH